MSSQSVLTTPSTLKLARRRPLVVTANSRAGLPPSSCSQSTPGCRVEAARPLTSRSCMSMSTPDRPVPDSPRHPASSTSTSRAATSRRGRAGDGAACIGRSIAWRPVPRNLGAAPACAARLGAPEPIRDSMPETDRSHARSVTLGTPLSPHATRVLLLGSGELGKEVALELQRFGVEEVAADRYPDAPAMQVAHRSHVLDMLDGTAGRALVARARPHLVVPEIEAIHARTLVELEEEFVGRRDGVRVIPTARAAWLTMDREGIRRLAAETLGIPTSGYRFVDTREEYLDAIGAVGLPCVVKPVMSSSGKGQSTVRTPAEVEAAWDHAQSGGRAGRGRVIVEGFVDFDYEITLLTVRHRDGTTFCEPIGHTQVDGDYRESWQPQPMSPLALERAQDMARRLSEDLGGWGVFGMEFFVRGDEVWFSEVS